MKTILNREIVMKKSNKNGLMELGISLLLFLNFFTDSDYLSLFGTAAVVISLLTARRDRVLPLAVYYSFFAYLFYYSGYNLYVFVAIALIIKAAFSVPNKLGVLLAISVSYLAVHLLSSVGYSLKLGDFIPFFTILCLCAASTLYLPSDRKNIIYAFVSGHLVSSVFGLFRTQTRLMDILETDYLSFIEWHDTVRFAGLSFDPNFYSLLAVIALYLVMLYGDLLFRKKATQLIVLFIIVLFGVITFSKSLILSCVVFFAASVFDRRSILRKRLLLFILVAVLGIFVFEGQVSRVLELIGLRFSDIETLDDFTSGRVSLWNMYMKELMSSWEIFIVGAGLKGRLLLEKAAHNTYLEILYKFGILGFVSNTLYFLYCNGLIKKEKKLMLADKVCVLLLAVLLFNLSAYTFYSLWTCLFVVMVVAKGVENEDICSGSGI